MFINFWLANTPPSVRDHELILGAENKEPEPFIIMPPSTSLEILARIAEVFPSSSRARKAGLRGPVPHGLEAWGTKRKRFFTFRSVPHSEPITCSPNFNKSQLMLGS